MKFQFISTSIFLPYSNYASAFAPSIRSSTAVKHHHGIRISIDDDEEDWRAFRARLVSNSRPNVEVEGAASNMQASSEYAHTTTFIELGSILVSIPTVDLCQAIDQQYWHRCVAIITKVSDDVVNGTLENEVPDDQLAQGAKRGRWSYRGLLLNRCTTFALENDDADGNPTVAEFRVDADASWRIHRGGDLLGLESSLGTRFVCLHNLGTSDPNVASISTKLVGNLSLTTIQEAKQLCKDYSAQYKPSDFMTFGGFISWRPGQLEREMGDERNEWLVLSVDGQSIWDRLQKQYQEMTTIISKSHSDKLKDGNDASEILDVCTTMWRRYLAMIGTPESTATKRIPSGQLNFYDQMLKVWAEEYLKISPTIELPAVLNDSSCAIKPGALVRAKCPPTNDMLLYDAEFIRSLILVLEDTPDATFGIILSHPMSAAVECVEGEDALPLRYGGPIDLMSWRDGSYGDMDHDIDERNNEMNDEIYEGWLGYQKNEGLNDYVDSDDPEIYEDDRHDDSSFIWIHRNKKVGGTALGESGVFLVEENDALLALQSGDLSSKDVMVFAGVSIWEKGSDLGRVRGGLREQIDVLGSFEVVSDEDKIMIVSAWDILSDQQDILTKDTLESNIDSAVRAYEKCSISTMHSESPESRYTKTELSDAALKAWIAVNLLEEPLETRVIITS